MELKDVLQCSHHQTSTNLHMAEAPLKIALECIFNPISQKEMAADKSQMYQQAREQFRQTYRFERQPTGENRFVVKLNRLPVNFSPSPFDGSKNTKEVLIRYDKLEKQLGCRKNTPYLQQYHNTIKELIDKGTIRKVGRWKDHEQKFLGPQQYKKGKHRTSMGFSEKGSTLFGTG